MSAYIIITAIAILLNGFSGIAAMARLDLIMPAMDRAGVPHSWLVFPIGVLKTTGAVGLLVGLFAFPAIGVAAAIGLVLFFVCGVYTHVRARDYSYGLALPIGFLAVAVAALVVGISQLT